MTNFLAELWDVFEDVPTLQMPLAVLVLIVFIVPIMVFAGLMELVDWMLQWTWKGVRITGNIGIDLACLALMTYSLIFIDNLLLFFIFIGLNGLIFKVFINDLARLSRHLKKRSG